MKHFAGAGNQCEWVRLCVRASTVHQRCLLSLESRVCFQLSQHHRFEFTSVAYLEKMSAINLPPGFNKFTVAAVIVWIH